MGITSNKQDINLAKKSYIHAKVSSQYTSNISVGDHIKYDTVLTTFGSDVSLDTTTTYTSTDNVPSIGRFLLKAGKTYHLQGAIQGNGATAISAGVKWYNANNGTAIGTSAFEIGPAHTGYNPNPIAQAFITTTLDTYVDLRIAYAGDLNTVQGSDAVYLDSWAVIESVDSTISLSPTYESAIGDWTSYSLTIGSTGTAPDEGGGTKYKRAMWRRVGDSMEILFEYRQSTGGSAGTGTYLWPIPPGYQIDTSKITTSSSTGLTHFGLCGHGWVNDNGGGMYPVASVAYDTTNIKLISTDYSYSGYEIGSTFETFANTDYRVFFLAKVPIVGWNRDLVFADSRVEYGSNTSTNDGDDTTTFSLETYGAVIPAVTSLYKKRVQFAYPITQTDEIEIQADWDGQGIWNLWEDQGYDNVEGKFGPTWEYVSGSKYQIDVWMRGNQHARFQNSTANFRSYTQENSAGSRWRVRKTANPLAVETPGVVSAIGDWTQYTPTFTGLGTVSDVYFFWRRVGDLLQIRGSVVPGTVTGSAPTFTLPPGLAIDTSKIKNVAFKEHFGAWGPLTSASSAIVSNIISCTFNGDPTVLQWVYASASDTLTNSPGSTVFNSSRPIVTLGLVEVPIVNWSSNIIIQDSKVEYVYNSSTSDGNDASAYATGASGGTVPSVTSDYYKEVQLSKVFNHVRLEFKESSGDWIEVGSSPFARQEHFGTTRYGALLIRQSDTLYRVYFLRAGYASASSGAAVTWATAASAGVKWRVVGSDNPLSVESAVVTGSSYAILDTLSGVSNWGSTNTKIPRFQNVSVVGSDLVTTQSATDGDSITISTTGGYSVEACTQYDGGAANYDVIVKNGSQLSTDPAGNNITGTLVRCVGPAGGASVLSRIVPLTAGDVIRLQGRGSNANYSSVWYFQITRLW